MISVIIPAYKNTADLVGNLSHNLKYFKDCEVIVVNDDPEISIKKDLKSLSIRLIENQKNLGFGGAVNQGVEKAKGKYILLLNSDVLLKDSSFNKTIKHFEQQDNLFAVTFAQKEKDGSIVGKNKFIWDLGLIRHAKADEMDSGHTAWAEGGASLINKDQFLKLGGFDSLYSPFYWEDIDLSYRAWKAGYEILFDNDIVVRHHHESTIGKYFEKKEIKKISFRNQHIFLMKNISDPGLMFSYWYLIIPNIIYFLLKKEPLFAVGFFQALQKFFEIADHRSKQRKFFILPDSKIFSKFHE